MSHHPLYRRLIQSARWRRLRRLKLSHQPLCEHCLRAGRIVAATEVHHIIPVESAPDPAAMRRLMFAYTNLAALCPACHDEAHRLLASHSAQARRDRRRSELGRFARHFLDDDDTTEDDGDPAPCFFQTPPAPCQPTPSPSFMRGKKISPGG